MIEDQRGNYTLESDGLTKLEDDGQYSVNDAVERTYRDEDIELVS